LRQEKLLVILKTNPEQRFFRQLLEARARGEAEGRFCQQDGCPGECGRADRAQHRPDGQATEVAAVQTGPGGGEPGGEPGQSLGSSLRRWPQVFDRLTIAMVEAGETGGVLDESLTRLAKLLEDNAKLQNQIKGAMGYPVAVFVIAIAVFLGMTIFIIPTFAGIFDDLGAELPWFTQMMVDVSSLLRSPFALLLVATA
jgi:hypothetical protein